MDSYSAPSAAVYDLMQQARGRSPETHAARHAQFDSASTLLGYIMGLAAQYAAGASLRVVVSDRSTFLNTLAAQWTENDPEEFPFIHRISAQLRDHDDRKQFQAGIELILNGIDQAL